jgi:hypothetical protein
MPKVTLDMDNHLHKKLTFIKEKDKRSIQKELEWLIEQRYAEISVKVEGEGK